MRAYFRIDGGDPAAPDETGIIAEAQEDHP